MKLAGTMKQRFLDKTLYTGDCIVWIGGLTSNGYGKFKYKKRDYRAHRVAWELENGQIPPTLVIDHLCRNSICVNPAHLRAVTQRENIFAIGSLSPAKKQYEQIACKRGHPLPMQRIGNAKGRVCRICIRLLDVRRRIRRQSFPFWGP